MTSELKILTVKEVAKILHVSTNYVYNNKCALGGFQACRSGRLLFSEHELQRRIRRNSNAISREERQMERSQDDRRQEADEIVQDKKRSQKVGGNVQSREIGRDENRHGILD